MPDARSTLPPPLPPPAPVGPAALAPGGGPGAGRPRATGGPGRRLLGLLRRWVDGDAGDAAADLSAPLAVEWPRILPFVVLHLGCLGVLLVGTSPVAVGVAVGLYAGRMFGLTAFYHRYFSHRAFKTSRFWQFCFAVWGNTAVQRGPLWWAAHHRRHHRYSDQAEDAHSPVVHGFLWSHIGWVTARRNFPTHRDAVPDLVRFPELRFLDRFCVLVPLLFAAGTYGLGAALARLAPGLSTSGPQMLVWGFFISTTVLLHGTFTINSLAHRWGSRRYDTHDDSRNNPVLALLTLGEGWHNNHHHAPGAVRQGHRWWEVDLTWYGLLLLERLGIVRDLNPLPRRSPARPPA